MPQHPETVFENEQFSVKLDGEELLIEPRQSAVLAEESARAAIQLSCLRVQVARIYAASWEGNYLAILGCFHERYSSGKQSGVKLRVGPMANDQARAAAAAVRARLGLPRAPKAVTPAELTTLPPGEHWVQVTGIRGPKGHIEAPDFEGVHLRAPIGLADLRGNLVVHGVLVVSSRNVPLAFGIERRELLAFLMHSAPPAGIDETPITMLFDEFRATSWSGWALRLLSPERIESLCGAVLNDPEEIAKSEGWVAYRLSGCVLIPQVLGHSSGLVSSLLGMSPTDLERLVYGANDAEPQFLVVQPGTTVLARNQFVSYADLVGTESSGLEVDRGVPALRRRLSELALPVTDAAVDPSPATRALEFFAQEQIRPEWVCLTTVPIPGKELRDAAVTAAIANLLKIAARTEKLKRLLAPKVILESSQQLLQRAFEDFYRAVAQSLRRLAGQ